jgi:hypothetical protein
MASEPTHPTPYPDVNAALNLLLSSVRAALHDQFVGMYLYGSLSSGDFDPETSDVDFVVVTVSELSDELVAALAAMHARIATSDLKWVAKLEGSYLPQGALQHYVRDDLPRPTLNEGSFYLAPHGWDWVIQRHILREHGVVVAGPPLRPMIDPVQPDDLRRAVRELLQEWWAPMIADPTRLERSDYQAYAILSMCRALHALHTGTIVSKAAAAAWAQNRLGERRAHMIEQAIAWRPGQRLDYLGEIVELIRYTVARANAHCKL